MQTVRTECHELQSLLDRLVGEARVAATEPATTVDAVVSPCEINHRHGTGVLLKNMFGGSSDLAVIYSLNNYQHENLLGAQVRQVSHQGLPRPEVYANVLKAVRGLTVRRVLCVPYFPDDALTAIALKDLFQAPLCTYLMDDNSIYSNGIPPEFMRELMTKSALRLMISPEMRAAYEDKYRLKCWIVPPLVAEDQILLTHRFRPGLSRGPTTGVLVGNVWDADWLVWLRAALRKSKLTLHWYCNGGNLLMNLSAEELARDGILRLQPKPERQLAPLLQTYAFAVVPSSTLESDGATQAIARLSLPSRIPFIMTSAQIPIIVLGSKQTAAAKFVERLGIGAGCPYDGDRLAACVAEFATDQRRRAVRENATRVAATFSARASADWVWESLDRGEPCDERFEKLLG